MRLALSNIAWTEEQDQAVYELMQRYGYTGLEIAPTRVFPQDPYDKLEEAEHWSQQLKQDYGFSVPSMQSIWFGRQEKLFGTEEERTALLEYTKKAIDFAAAVECRNLVFGCPRNRFLPEGASPQIAVDFFRALGAYAVSKGTVIGLEANPPIYHTNFINDTRLALALIEEVGSDGFRLNLDVGTMVENNEDAAELIGKTGLINHVHISEPGLVPVKERELHRELLKLLRSGGYDGFVSIEMGKTEELSALEYAAAYLAGL